MIENETPKFADFQEFFAEIYAFLDKVHTEMEIFVKNLSPYCEQNEQKALTRFEMAMQMEKEFLMDNLVIIEEPNAKIKRFFEKFDSSLFAKLTSRIVDMLTMDSLLKDERKRHFSKLFGNSNEAQRRFVRSPPKFGDAMNGVKEVACCWMPKKKDENVFFVNNGCQCFATLRYPNAKSGAVKNCIEN
ncbi:hypothetical protein niasHS_002950 [Heterodera schachtii]|uniref:Uncharacterized protein n=1 Tax=Heterodera schachtii TaxID=97005 RepID=A0ABD2K995_HETSC